MSSAIKRIEQERGQTIAEILQELYAQHGNTYEVARELGVSQGTISLWVQRAGLEFETRLVKREEVA